MSKSDLTLRLLGNPLPKLSRAEKLFLEIKLFTCICHELSDFFKSRYNNYQQLINPYMNQDVYMYNVNFMQEMIKDILSTKEYSLTGIANYTLIPEEVLYEIAIGINTNPTFELSRKIFELHIEVRCNLYSEIMQKITSEFIFGINKRNNSRE